eukprot:g73444.t1
MQSHFTLAEEGGKGNGLNKKLELGETRVLCDLETSLSRKLHIQMVQMMVYLYNINFCIFAVFDATTHSSFYYLMGTSSRDSFGRYSQCAFVSL